jgi:hypothetical protein
MELPGIGTLDTFSVPNMMQLAHNTITTAHSAETPVTMEIFAVLLMARLAA